MKLLLKELPSEFNDVKNLEKINYESFPIEERLEINKLLEMANTDLFSLYLAYEDKKLVGFILLAVNKPSIYIFLFAIDKSVRSKGYGSTVLRYIKELYPEYQIVLDLERINENSPNIKQRISRKNFYIRNGYFETGYFMDYNDVEFEVLCNDHNFNQDSFTKLLNKINNIEGDNFYLSIYKD